MNQAYLSIRNVSKAFGKYTALDKVQVDIIRNEFVCLLGPSGCGKTTLLRILAGLEQPDRGQVLVNGKDITSLPPAKRNVGMMFQSYALFPNMTAYQNIAYGLQGKKLSKREIDDKVREVLELVDLLHIRDKYPAQLSGGQQQRIALARAIALSPDFLLLDEPLSALDAKVRHKLRREIRLLHEKIGITTIMVTHDQDEALTMADKIVVMNNAKIEQIGTPEEVYERPNSPFVGDFIGAINFFDGGELADYAAQEDVMYAIRPEHVRVLEQGSDFGIQAVVKDIEFRGPFYRVLLDNNMTLDLSAQLSQQMKLKKNTTLSLELPLDRLIAFERAATAK